MLPVSVCMIVKNEEKKLSRCLESVKPYGFEIVIVDTGSQDKTCEVASHFTDKIFHFAWCDDFSAARNYSLEMASNDWILMLDADEVIENLDLEEMDYFMKNLSTSAGAVTRRNQVTTDTGKEYQIDRTERLYSRKNFRYAGRIHEQLTPVYQSEMSCYLLNATIWHDGYDMTKEERWLKANRNIMLLEKQISEEGETPYLYYQLGKGYEIKEDYEMACECFEKGLDYDIDPQLAYVIEMVTSYGDDLLRIGKKEIAMGFESIYDEFSISADFLYLMGRIYQENGLFSKALIEYQKATKVEFANQEGANSFLAYYHMATIYATQNRIGEAIKHLTKCHGYEPSYVLKNQLLQEQQKKKITVFVATHVKFSPPTQPIYLPLHVGREGKNDLGYLGDNIGENISDLNYLFGELTGLYWIWKNISFDDTDYVGLCHYRRYFINSNGYVMDRNTYLELLKQYDVIIPKHEECEVNYKYYYGQAHNIKDLEAVEKAILKLYPEYIQSFKAVMEGKTYFCGNLCITSLFVLKEYAKWLFDIFAEASQEIDVTNYDDYHKRVYGFLSEQMMFVYILQNELTYCEVPVGIASEKAETQILKNEIASLFKQKKITSAKEVFEKTLRERPDVLLENSDIYNELRMLYQIIHLCLVEEEQKENSLLSYSTDTKKLLEHYQKIISILRNRKLNAETEEERMYLKQTKVSDAVLKEIIKCTPSLQRS